MAQPTPQTYQNHARWVPLYHFVAGMIFPANAFVAAYQMVTSPSLESGFGLLLAVALVLAFFYLRAFALAAQDRVIRLEERLRMQALLPEDLTPRIYDFTTQQLIALRFASDEELPALARRVLDENIVDQKPIKQAITAWRADYQRV